MGRHFMTRARQTLALSLASALALSAVSPAFAAAPVATLDLVTGKVMVSHGEGFATADAGLSLKPGDRVMVGEDAQANIAFGACAVTVAAQSLFVVPEKAPCKKGESLAYVDSGFIQPANSNFSGFPPAHMIAVGAGVLGLAGIALIAASYDKPDPASPNGPAP
jgi:hypothetical protein